MRKKLTTILISMFLMGVVFAGCATNNAPAQSPPAASVAQEALEPPTTPAVPETQIETRSAVQEFLDEYGDDIRADFGELAELLGEGAWIDITAGDGEEFIFIFAFGPEDTDALAGALYDVIPLLSSVFDTFTAQLQEELGVDELTVTVRYEGYDGSLLAQESFFAS